MSLKIFIIILLVHTAIGAGESMFGNMDQCTYSRQVTPIIAPDDTEEDSEWILDEQPFQALAEYHRFDWALIRSISLASGANFLISPVGLKLALAILVEASTGKTREELMNSLGFEDDRNIVRKKFTTIIESLQTKSPYFVANVGSNVYIDDASTPRQRFVAVGNLFYNTNITSTDFDDPSEAAKSIDAWIANVTEGTFGHSVNEADVTEVVMLIMNIVNFKGIWQHEFPLQNTKIGLFRSTPKSQKLLPYMNVKNKFYMADSTTLDANILRMPFVGNKFAMYLIVPNEIYGLQHVFKNLHSVRSDLDWLQERMVDLSLPKFRIDFTTQLDDVLKETGVKAALGESASFPGISRGQETKRLRISKVLQRTRIEITEQGVTAYPPLNMKRTAPTSTSEEENSRLRHVSLFVNRPFGFFIQDESTRQILLTGSQWHP